MTRDIGWGPAARTVLVLAGLTVVVVGMQYASSVLGPIFLGAFFAVVSYPAVAALRRRGLPNWAAITVTALSVVVVMVLVGLTLYSSLSQLSEDLPTYEEEMAERTASVDAWLQDHGIEASGTLGLDGIRDAHYPSSTEYVEVDPGTLDLQIVQSDTTTVLLEVPGVTIAEGMVYDLVLAGIPGDEEAPLQVIIASAQAAA